MTPEILQKIKDKAKNPDPRFWGNKYEHEAFEKGFTAGASFVLSSPEVLREVLRPFAEWERDNVIADGAPKRIYRPDGKRYTTEELIQKYIADNKQKEYERHS